MNINVVGFGPASNVPEWRASAPGPMTGLSYGEYKKCGEKLGDFRSGYVSEVIKLADCQFSDALLGYTWANDNHWNVRCPGNHDMYIMGIHARGKNRHKVRCKL